jgi:DNA-binding transcriptional MerR regulator
MEYTVKEVARITGVTVKTLHYYHKIGLLLPCKVTDAGYRMYGKNELELLQQILFFRELDFSLENIRIALEDETKRVDCLIRQKEMLLARKHRTDCLLNNIEESIIAAMKGETMIIEKMFNGLNKEQWESALSEQNKHIKENYDYDMLQDNPIDVDKLNEQAKEAQEFTNFMINALRNGLKANDEKVQGSIKKHIEFMNESGIKMDAKMFSDSTKFFLEDDFHRNMYENQQTGLSYYMSCAAEMFLNNR